MDYEKKYNEALERARKAYNAIPPESRGARKIIEDAFPELRESEDERIRKTLVEYFGPQAQLDFIRGVPIQKIRDWLEKQKENTKSADSIPANCASNAKCEDRSLKHTDSFGTDIRDTPAYWRGWDDAMKQKEQKPVEWTDLTWKDIIELEGIINKVHYEFRNGIGQESFGKEVLERFREYKGDKYLDEKEQKPAEWGEEQEEPEYYQHFDPDC